jgi:hypothetical protein
VLPTDQAHSVTLKTVHPLSMPNLNATVTHTSKKLGSDNTIHFLLAKFVTSFAAQTHNFTTAF